MFLGPLWHIQISLQSLGSFEIANNNNSGHSLTLTDKVRMHFNRHSLTHSASFHKVQTFHSQCRINVGASDAAESGPFPK